MKSYDILPLRYRSSLNRGSIVVQSRFRSVALLATMTCLVIWPRSASAQQVPTDPTSSHIFPAGGQRGTKVAVRVGGECLPPMTRFRMFGKGLTADVELGPKAVSRGESSPRRKPGEFAIYFPKEWHHSIDIASDAPLGMSLWRLSSARGGTAGRPFIVGELPEFIETESNSTLELAERVSLPVTINGQIEGERDLDYFQFPANEGEVITVDVNSRRLGSPLEPVAEIYDSEGARMAVQRVYMGSDPVLSFCAPHTGVYRLMLAHLGFHGGPQFVYRVTLSTKPFVSFVFPAGSQAGTRRIFEGYAMTGRGKIQPIPFEFEIPQGTTGEHWLHNGLPNFNSVAIQASELADFVEQENNDTVATAQLLTDSCDIHGRFLDANDEDWYRFTATKDSLWAIECNRFPRGSDCLPVVTLTNSVGVPLSTASMANDPRQPCRIQWRSPADGSYCLRVRDVQQGIRGGPDFIYRLSLKPALPGLELSLSADFANVIQGAKSEIELRARRTGEFSGPIELKVEGLPEGVRFEPKQIDAGQDTIKLAFVADEQASPCDATLKIRGIALHDQTELSSVAMAPHQGHDSENVSLGPLLVDHLHLTVRHKPVLRLFCSEAYQYAYRGTVYPYAMEVERLNGFTGPIHIEVADRQIKDLDGIVVHETTIAPDQTQFKLPIYLPESMHINVQAHSNVYAQAYVVYPDPRGEKQSQLFVSEMRCMIRPLPAVAKLSAVNPEVVGKAGDTIECRLRLDRTSLFAGAMTVELVEPAIGSGFAAKPITIAPDQSTASIWVHLPASPELSAGTKLKFQATGEMPGYLYVISQATIQLKSPTQE